MAQRQFRKDDTSPWGDRYGYSRKGNRTISADVTWGGASGESNATAVGTTATAALTLGAASGFANGDLILVHQSRSATTPGVWELNKVLSGGGTTSLTLAYNLCNTYSCTGAEKAQVIGMPDYDNLTLNSGVSWIVPEWDGNKGGIAGCFVNNLAYIQGTIDARGKGFIGAPGSTDPGDSGEGYASGGNGNTSNADDSGGGGGDGGGGSGGSGGGGGNNITGATDGNQRGGVTTGKAGLALAQTELIVMVFGGGGGSGGGDGSSNGGNGGDGSGIFVLIARKITVTGSMTSRGADGQGSGGIRGAGGAGAGGHFLLKGQIIDIGTNLIAVGPGAGGVGGTQGGQGGNGMIEIDYSLLLTGSSTYTNTRQDGILSDFGASLLASLL